MKTKILLVSHGDLAKGMAHSAQMIAGVQQNLFFYGMQPGEHPSQIFEKIRKEIQEDTACRYIILVDVFGGSVCNHAMELLNCKNVHLISGMNLSLVVELMVMADFLEDEELKDKIETAKQGIKVVSLDAKVLDDKEFF